MSIADKKVTALIGPSGCGKTTFLRCFNRLHDLYPNNRYRGDSPVPRWHQYRQQPGGSLACACASTWCSNQPFPKSIFENVAYGLRLRGVRNKHTPGHGRGGPRSRGPLGGEPRTACSSRRIACPAVNSSACVSPRLAWPEILLCDEPTSALDPGATARIEELLQSIKDRVHSHHRDAQYAASGASPTIPVSCTWVNWWRWAGPLPCFESHPP